MGRTVRPDQLPGHSRAVQSPALARSTEKGRSRGPETRQDGGDPGDVGRGRASDAGDGLPLPGLRRRPVAVSAGPPPRHQHLTRAGMSSEKNWSHGWNTDETRIKTEETG